MKATPHKPKEGEWFPVAPSFVWRCCECGHAAQMKVRVRKGNVELSGREERVGRCALCNWALYDGTWCQNPKCKRYGKRGITRRESTRKKRTAK